MTMDFSYVAPGSEGRLRHQATAASKSAPLGAWGLPRTYSKVVSSGAMRPARAPPSMDMLQMVIRSSIDRARMACTGVLEHVAGATADADARDEVEDDVLGRDTRSELAVHAHLVRAGRSLEQGLGRQHHLDLGRADAERERPERTMGRGVRVAAHDGHARLRQAQLGADDMDDALVVGAAGVDRDAELGAVALQLGHLEGGLLVEDGQRQGCRWASSGPPWRPSARGAGRAGRAVAGPANAWGLVTSWTRCRSMPMTLGAPGSSNTTCSSQIFWTSVRGAAASWLR